MEKRSLLVQFIAQNIRKNRKESGFSQEGFADAVRLDRRNYGAIERGERMINVASLAKFAARLNMHPGDFFPDLKTLSNLVKKEKSNLKRKQTQSLLS